MKVVQNDVFFKNTGARIQKTNNELDIFNFLNSHIEYPNYYIIGYG